jgi:DNA-binding FadR family transcriptional regulator
MTFEKLEVPSMTDLFVKTIEEKILTGELKEGERLLTERTLAEKLGVSLAVVHNGMKRLEDLGFVKIVPRQGTFVADYARCGGVNTLTELIKYAGTGYDMHIIRQFADLRKVLEFHFYEDACTNASDEELARIKDILDRYVESVNIHERAGLYFDFVHEVSFSCGNIVSPMLLMTFRDLYTSFYLGQSRFETAESMNEQLESIYALLESRDKEHIVEAVEKHINWWLDSYSAHYSAAIQ